MKISYLGLFNICSLFSRINVQKTKKKYISIVQMFNISKLFHFEYTKNSKKIDSREKV